MLKAMSTYVYVKERLHPGLLDGLVRGGAQAVEIFAARQHIDYANRGSMCVKLRIGSAPAAFLCTLFTLQCMPIMKWDGQGLRR